MSIPNKLRDDAINFCLVEKPIRDNSNSGKRPFQENWPNLDIKWNNKNLTTWIGQGGNYGVIGGGEKNLIIIDFDNKEVQDEVIKKLPETFTVKTGSGLLHKYYFTNGGNSFKVLDENGKTLIDIQSNGKQVVGPGSLHYSGNTYSIHDNLPIATITYEEVKELLMPYHKYIKGQKNVPVQKPKQFSGIDDFQEDLFNSVTFESLLSEFGVDVSKNPSNCPFHDSKGGKCLGWDDNTAHCFHCDGAWNKISWIKDNKNCDAKEAIEWLAEREGRIKELEDSREKWKEDKLEKDIIAIKKTIQGKEETVDFEPNIINWTEEKIKWVDMKEDIRTIIRGRDEMFIVANKSDFIKGKPQLIHTTKKKITLVRKVMKEDKYGIRTEKIKFLDEGIDKKVDGVVINSWSHDFWVYRIISNDKEYYVLSEQKMPHSICIVNGMLMELNDITEMNNSMKIKSLSNLFFANNFEPAIKILTKEEIVKFTKDKKITEQEWFDIQDTHPLGTKNRFPYESNIIRSAFVLSGEKDEWPMHLGVIGPAGTRKSCGYIETIAHKFEEEPKIVEGGNSRIKGLSPSFKEKPANIGYLAKCERMGWIDEIGKMIEFETQRHDIGVTNVLGELNFLLDHKIRTVGSGNDNECVVKATAKFMFISNPVKGKRTLSHHIGIIDPTTMSRILWWVQSPSEQEFVLSPAGIEEPTNKHLSLGFPRHHVSKTVAVEVGGERDERDTLVSMCWGESVVTREEYLTLFDTTNSFLCEIDKNKVIELSDFVSDSTRELMRAIWKPRGRHHVELLIDGIIKHRCLFIDYDASFKVKPEDYVLAKKILEIMVKNWDTDLGMSKQIGGGY